VENPVNDHLDRDDRPELHVPSIDEDVALQGECGRVHLPTGDTCRMPRHHAGSCQFENLSEVSRVPEN
jgi:hypothetical protein